MITFLQNFYHRFCCVNMIFSYLGQDGGHPPLTVSWAAQIDIYRKNFIFILFMSFVLYFSKERVE